MQSAWKFDEAVAQRFDREARTHIPNYELVVQKCIDIATRAYPDKAVPKILDVGSATGHTLARLREAGFENVWGVDNSEAMLEHSRVQEGLIHSHTFPTAHGPFDMVLANWTLHFIFERRAYIEDIRNSIREGGVFILTDKMSSTPFVHERYHDFKRSMGVSESEILRKQESLKGVLETLPLDWYMDTLKQLEFKNIQIIDAAYCFNTLIAFA
jgi:SAM-dependent methyltransferase